MKDILFRRTDSTTLGFVSNYTVGVKISPRYKLEKIDNLDKDFKKKFYKINK